MHVCPSQVSPNSEFIDDPASADVEFSTMNDDEVSMLGEDDFFEVLDASQK
jgi:hypothetical protein